LPVMLDDRRQVACDSQEARDAVSAYIVPIVRMSTGMAMLSVTAFGGAYWSGDWPTLQRKRVAAREAAATREGGRHRVLSPATVVHGVQAPLVLILESSTFFSLRGAEFEHYANYYTVAGEYAIEISVSAPDRFSLPGAMSVTENAITCSACKLPEEALSGDPTRRLLPR